MDSVPATQAAAEGQGPEGAEQPASQVAACDHDENLIEQRPVEPVVKPLYLQVHGVLRTHR